MANKYRDLNVVAPPKNRKYIPVLQYTAKKDEAGNFSYTVESKSVIPKKIQGDEYGSIILSDGTKLLYFTNEVAGPITYVLLSNGEVYSDEWLFNHIDYVEKNLVDSSNNPLDIIKKLTSDEDIAKVKELIKKLDFDHFLNISYNSSSNSVTLDMNNVTPYQGEDKVQPQKDNDGNWYLPKTDNAYGELGIGYAQSYVYDSTTGHNTILTPDFETVTDDAGLKFVRAKKPAEVYPNAVSGDIYPILPAKRRYTGKRLNYNMVPHSFSATIDEMYFKGDFSKRGDGYYYTNNYYDIGSADTPEKAQKELDKEIKKLKEYSIYFVCDKNYNYYGIDPSVFKTGYVIELYYISEKYTDSLEQIFEQYNPLFNVSVGTDKNITFRVSYSEKTTEGTTTEKYVTQDVQMREITLTLKEGITTSFDDIEKYKTYINNNIPYSHKECIFDRPNTTFNLLDTDKTIGWHNVMNYDGSVWTPKDFMSSITKTYTLASGAATEKTDGTGTFYKFDDTMYPFSNSDIADIVCGKNFTVFLLNDGSVWTCGANYHGQLGKGTDADKDILQITPMPIDIGSFTAVAAKEQTWVTIGNNGVLYACGANTFGQFGLGDKKDRSVLTPIADNVERVQLTAGNIIIRKANGTVYGAGYNYDDRLNLNVCKCITKFTKLTEVE